jgi:hypothetical protein
MSIQEVFAEQLAELFHHYHRARASESSRQTDQAEQSWREVSQLERNRMIAAARRALLELDSVQKKAQESKRYFAKPGEAEWGC